jgi:hypothetical protein
LEGNKLSFLEIILEIIGAAVIITVIVLYEWPKFNKGEQKEKIAFITLLGLGFLLFILLINDPDMFGPTDIVVEIFKPLFPLLEG